MVFLGLLLFACACLFTISVFADVDSRNNDWNDVIKSSWSNDGSCFDGSFSGDSSDSCDNSDESDLLNIRDLEKTKDAEKGFDFEKSFDKQNLDDFVKALDLVKK
mgnify:CR=1 FL=1